jgi:quercetin dioxygenase-like cupin family protein
MKKLMVKNYQTLEGQRMGQNGNHFIYKPLIPHIEAKQCMAGFVEVKPGNFAFSYHYHEFNEEIFYIISGKGIVKTVKGEISVKEGDTITFPAGERGAHVIRNASDIETLIYIAFGPTILLKLYISRTLKRLCC